MIKVLVVDDSALLRKLIGGILENHPEFQVEFARDGLEALAKNASFAPDVITLDVQMPQMDGLGCLDRIMLERPCPVVMLSSQTAEGADATVEALRLGAVDFVPKPSGALSLRLDEFAPLLLQKLRTAATVKLRASLRLRERVQFRLGSVRQLKHGTQTVAATRPPAAGREGLVLIGISTGGPPALDALLGDLPEDFAWPILIAQHMPANFTGPLAERLDELCALHVVEVSHTMALEPGTVYIGRGDADIIVSPGRNGLFAMTVPAQKDYPWHPSTDRLVLSAMQHLPATQLIGVLMTGMGDDGAKAMAALHAAGGTTIAESAETAVIWGMPGELVGLGGASSVLPLPQIAERLLRLTSRHAAHT